MSKFVTFLENWDDQLVRAYAIYKKASETKAYVDSGCTVQYKTSELKNVFIKGAIIILEDGSMAKPVGYAESSSIGSVTYMVNSSGAAFATLSAAADA